MDQVNLRMREIWDELARNDPMFSVDQRSGQHFENIEACYEDGKEQVNALMSSMLERLAFDPIGKRIMDVGCGFGRLFPGFAELGFTEIWGVDISPEMTRLGEQQCPVPSARFVVVDGGGLTGIDSNYFNFCFSRGVFLHLPEEQALWSYLHEIHRALVPGGTFQLDFEGHPTIKSTVLRMIPERARPWARTAAKHVKRVATQGRLEHAVSPSGATGLVRLATRRKSPEITTDQEVGDSNSPGRIKHAQLATTMAYTH